MRHTIPAGRRGWAQTVTLGKSFVEWVVAAGFTSYHGDQVAEKFGYSSSPHKDVDQFPSAGGGTVPLSEHEQRMLDQIESALYAEDPKFASTVKAGRVRAASSKRRLQAAALFVLGLVLLVAGVALPFKPGNFPVISLVGFLLMFGAGVLLLLGGSVKSAPSSESGSGRGSTGRGNGFTRQRGPRRGAGGFTARMEERFRRRFEQD